MHLTINLKTPDLKYLKTSNLDCPINRVEVNAKQRVMIMPDNPFIVIPVQLGKISLNHNLIQNLGYWSK